MFTACTAGAEGPPDFPSESATAKYTIAPCEVVEGWAGYPVGNAVQAALGDWISVSPDNSEVVALEREHHLDLGESEAILVAEALASCHC